MYCQYSYIVTILYHFRNTDSSYAFGSGAYFGYPAYLLSQANTDRRLVKCNHKESRASLTQR
jgi:hypothetical protein